MIDSSLILFVEALAVEAGKAILKVYDSSQCDISIKADGSPLTVADSIANNIIIAGLREKYPNIQALSEENVDSFILAESSNKRYWLIDPLDGTKEFIAKNGEFTVNIALVDNGKVLLGVIYAPVLDLLYSAFRGNGAVKVQDGHRKYIKVSDLNSINVWRVLGSRSHTSEKFKEWVERLDFISFIPKGSSLKFCLIAEGAADIYPRLGPTSLWDTAAGQCILEEAGGSVRSLENGNELSYEDPFKIINPDFVALGKIVPEFLSVKFKNIR